MKIDVKNSNLLKDNRLKIYRKTQIGLITAALVVGIPTLMFFNRNNERYDLYNKEAEVYEEVILEDPINVNIQDVNKLNIIIDDNDCSNSLMDGVYEELQNDGIKFTTTSNSKNVDIDNSIVISLDQQYSSGPDTLIIGPYNNDTDNKSDALALAMSTGFYEKGFIVNGVTTGVLGFAEDENGEVVTRIPSKLEKEVNNKATFVTISFGTANVNAKLVASAIEDGLVRYISYINSNDLDTDLIYRALKDDTIESISKKLDSSESFIKLNNVTDSDNLENKTFVNPITTTMREFDKNVPINLYVEKTLWSK